MLRFLLIVFCLSILGLGCNEDVPASLLDAMAEDWPENQIFFSVQFYFAPDNTLIKIGGDEENFILFRLSDEEIYYQKSPPYLSYYEGRIVLRTPPLEISVLWDGFSLGERCFSDDKVYYDDEVNTVVAMINWHEEAIIVLKGIVEISCEDKNSSKKYSIFLRALIN